MNLEPRLRAFAAVARAGSFSRAAQALHVSQPAVSKHVAALEAELGTKLLVRDRKGISLTPAGDVLADYVLRAEALLANAERAVGSDADAERGTLALAASGIPGTYLIPDLLARFHERTPNVALDFRLATSGEALELVRAHEVELAVVGGLDVPTELQAEALFEDELVLVGPPSLSGRRLRGRDLRGLTWISREEGSSTRAAVEAARWQLGLHAVRTLELPSWEAVKLAVQHGVGIAAISRLALELELEVGRLTILDVPRWRVVRTISVVVARDVPLTPPAARFVELLRQTRRSHAADERPPNSNLPALPDALVGRRRERDEIIALLRRRNTRLVNLTGTGGGGKTRLALDVASKLVDDFRDGVYLVELAPLGESTLVLPTVARTLGAPDTSDLAAWLGDRRLLLVLDNVEHLLDAAVDLVGLVRATTALKILATSRAPLQVRGEQLYPVEPLPTGDAIALFVERALAVDPRFELGPEVREICERLDGLPLAIELAAGRVATLGQAGLLERLERRLPVLVRGAADLPSRQRTLRGTIDWSFELLAPGAKRGFARLSVFRGGWSADAAETICRASPETVQTLVEHALVRQDGSRCLMLETIREHAAERLGDGNAADALRRRHADFFTALARTARSFARGPDEKEWFDRIAVDLGNVRAALRWTIDSRDRARGLALAEALEPFWYRRTLWREGLAWLEQLLGLPGDVPADVRAGSLLTAGRLAFELGDDRGRQWFVEAERLARNLRDDGRLAWALHGLGHTAWLDGDLDRARALFGESAELFAAIGQHGPAGGRYTYLAALENEAGDPERARELLERSIVLYARAGDRDGVAGSTAGLGDLELAAGRTTQALARYSAALPVITELGNGYGTAGCFAGIAAGIASEGEGADAARLWGAAERLEAELEFTLPRAERELYVRLLGELDPRATEAGRLLSTADAVALALSRCGHRAR